jgi:D-alanyl-D-alanine carboxypeptidase (penicillin-binding protein 5/6)
VELDGSPATDSESPAVVESAAPSTPVLGGAKLGLKGPVVDRSGGAKKLPKVKARTWVLADATTGEVLAAKKAHKKRRPASTIKTLTALTLLPKLDPSATWTGTARAANTYGSKVGIKKGREYTIDQLFYGLMLPSGNDAAIALAQANSSVPKTVREMNEVAQRLQAYSTTAANTSGLDAKGQFSTAYDLTLIARAALEREDFRNYATTKKAQFPNPKKKRKKPIDIYNQNDLVLDGYRGVVGVKTGYTSKAGRTFIGAAERDGRTLIVTLMGIREPSDKAAKKLLNWGFRNRDAIVPIGQLVDPLTDETVMVESSIEPAATAVASQPVSAPAELSASPEQATLSSLSPTAWGWLAVFCVGTVLAFVTGLRWIRGRKQRRLVT